METVLKSPRPPKRRTWTPTVSASTSASVSTRVGAEVLAPLLRRPRACDGRRERQDEQRCGSVRRLRSLPARRDEEAERRAPAAEAAREPTQLLPRGRTLCWPQPGRSSGSGIILPRSLPTPKGSGCDRVRPPSQLRGSGGFAPPSLTRLMSSRALARVCERCQGA